MRWFFLFLACVIHTHLFAKVRILTFHYNQPDFIELQVKTLKKFLLDDFELIVFNDADTRQNAESIEQVCNENGIQCVRYEQEWHFTSPLNAYLKKRLEEAPSALAGLDGSLEEIAAQGSVRHSHVIQYALDHFGYDHDDIVVIMDGDNFIINYLSIRELLGSCDIVGVNKWYDEDARRRIQGEKTVAPGDDYFLWVVFIAFDPRKLPDVRQLQFHVDLIEDRGRIDDTGSAFCRYRKDHPNLKIETFAYQSCNGLRQAIAAGHAMSGCLTRFLEDIYPYDMQFYLFEHCLHFMGSSFGGKGQEVKAYHLNRFITDILKADPPTSNLDGLYF